MSASVRRIAATALALAALASASCSSRGGGIGSACSGASDCASGLCAAGACTVACADHCGCPEGFECATASEGLRVCRPGPGRCGGTDAGPPPGHDAGPPIRVDGGGGGARCVAATADGDCGDNLDCGSVCCDAAHPYHCPSTDLCYATESAASADCGGVTCTRCAAGVASHEVYCSESSHAHAWDPECTCTALDSRPGPARYYGSSCDESPSSPVICCADTSYPGSGSCSCYYRLTWACTDTGSTQCHCEYYTSTAGLSLTSVCNDDPAADGIPWLCCARTYGSCRCIENFTGTSCPSGERSVTDCVPRPMAPVTSCPAGTRTVTSCSAGLP